MQQILKDLENAFPFLNVPKPKAGRKPKLTDIHTIMAYLQKIQTQESIQDIERIQASQAEAYDFSKAFVW